MYTANSFYLKDVQILGCPTENDRFEKQFLKLFILFKNKFI